MPGVFKQEVVMGDITRLHGGRLPPVDIITFGSPCQGLSIAGQRRGLADVPVPACLERGRFK